MADRRQEADKIIKRHVIWAAGAGLMPVPLVDLAAVTTVQLGMLDKLCKLHQVDASQAQGTVFVTALTGGSLAKIGASLIKSLPFVGSFLGGLSMSALSGASTYAIGEVALAYLEDYSDLSDVDLTEAKAKYDDALKKGKAYVSNLNESDDAQRDAFAKLKQLQRLKEQGVLTDEEFEAKKEALLDKV